MHVYDGWDLTHRIKEILLPSIKNFDVYAYEEDEDGMATCRWSNSFYVWKSFDCMPTTWPYDSDIWHLVPNGVGGFEELLWPPYVPQIDSYDFSTVGRIGVSDISVLDDGNLLVLRRVFCLDDGVDNILSIHKPDGSVIRNMKLSHDAKRSLSNIAMKSNGNFVFAQVADKRGPGCVIREADKDGNAFRNFHYSRYKWKFPRGCKQLFLDACDRVILLSGCFSFIFLDCELNLLGEIETFEKKPGPGPDRILVQAEFDKDTNELVTTFWSNRILFLKLTL